MKRLLLVLPLLFATPVYAQDTVQFNSYIQDIHAHNAKIVAELGLNPDFNIFPQATSYYDDKVAHYEADQIMSDFIDKGIR